MIAIELNKGQIARLENAVRSAGKKMATELAGAINAVSKKTKLDMGRDVTKRTVIKKVEAEKPISVASSATQGRLQAVVRLKKTRRLGLIHFGAKQNKSGVSYKISKSGKSLRSVGAFMGPKPGSKATKLYGNAAKRTSKKRLPIIIVKGVSAFGAYRYHSLQGPQVEATRAELTKQIEKRINFNVLRANGLIKH